MFTMLGLAGGINANAESTNASQGVAESLISIARNVRPVFSHLAGFPRHWSNVSSQAWLYVVT